MSGNRIACSVTIAHSDLPKSITVYGACRENLTVGATDDSTASVFAALEAVFEQVQAIKAA
ncbi:hypothetical protein OU994_17510 [Pseudoduganella sp. SL102]|uniref:hypothetical protein n=1 Tax=Pseudoduganella sp. SL102 TaxID=2995154 RepID=UPI00248C5056|nr:hypothetical protein [Pseudoduganella sp. SL102]WBS00121.1 hypothetical protein OU994_17510 [Pseudoduganella sp. SL102]